MYQLLAIAGGGALGAVLRFYASQATHGLLGKDFPYGTLFVNVSGSLAMGVLYILLVERLQVSPEARAALMVGLLGAFTTFSTFSIETLVLVEEGELTKAGINILASVILCLLAAGVGMFVGRQL